MPHPRVVWSLILSFRVFLAPKETLHFDAFVIFRFTFFQIQSKAKKKEKASGEKNIFFYRAE
jgi:hypothetical protein